jgi:hypothetical protein
MCPAANLDAVEKIDYLLAREESNPGLPSHNLLLQRLSNPGSHQVNIQNFKDSMITRYENSSLAISHVNNTE